MTGNITQQMTSGTSGLGDIAGNPAEASIKMAIANRLVDGINGAYRPKDVLRRIKFADYLLMGQAIRQFVPTTGAKRLPMSATKHLAGRISDGKRCSPARPGELSGGVMKPNASGNFDPNGEVNRVSLAYSLVQSLGLQTYALERNGKPVTVNVDGKNIPIEDASMIPTGMEGYVSIALQLNMINAYFTATQAPYELKPTIHATFKPNQVVTRADFAVIITRTFPHWEAATSQRRRLVWRYQKRLKTPPRRPTPSQPAQRSATTYWSRVIQA